MMENMTEKLLAEISTLKEKLETVEKERDSAVNALKFHCKCMDCKYDNTSFLFEPCKSCYNGENWDWRGVQ